MDTSLIPDTEPIIRTLLKVLPVALLVLVGAAAARFLLNRGLNLVARRARLCPSNFLPIKKILNGLLYAVTVVLLLTLFGVNLGGIWAVLSTVLAMIAIGFVAVWSLLSNVSSTLLILLTRPFAVGDEVEFAGEQVKGKVVDLNFLYTTLRDTDGTLVQIPNNQFFQKCLKRKRGTPAISLAEQLSRDTAAES